MKISSIRIENFRCFLDETIFIDDYACLVGPNGSGKSTVLTAFNIFFRETENATTNLVVLCEEDFHSHDTSKPIKITVTFEDLEPAAQEDFKAYYRQGKLVVTAKAIWDETSKSAEVKQFGLRSAVQGFRKYFEMDKNKATAQEMKDYYNSAIQPNYTGLPKYKSKAQVEKALHDYEESHPAECEPTESEDQFYGVSRGANRMEKYLQWVYVPAVKDASSEQPESKNSAISKLLARRVYSQLSLAESVAAIKTDAYGKYAALLKSNETELNNLADLLTKKFQQWAHDGASLQLQWQDQERAVSISSPVAEVKATEGVFKGNLSRFGHGLQRSFIFALLEELSEHTTAGTRLILGCEEPELYQHPPQARHLSTVLQKLSSQNSQVLLCTHSPYFISGKNFENIRLAEKARDGSVKIKFTTCESVSKAISKVLNTPPVNPGGVMAKIQQEMETSINEMFFANFRIFVEGIEDVAYITTYMVLMDKWDTFRSFGGHIIPVNGKEHLIQTLAISNEFHLPYYVVFDCDSDTPADTPERPTGRRKKHQNENLAIFALAGTSITEPFPEDIIITDNLTAWPTKIGDIVNEEISDLRSIKESVRQIYGIDDTPNMDKNCLFIGYVMADAWAKGKKSAVLEKLCDDVIDFMKNY